MSEENASSEVTIPPAGSTQEPANPFIGTEFFHTGDKIFGRDGEIEEFTTRLLAHRIVLLHSPSGVGKTSLVQAGLIPTLNKKGLHILPKIRLNNELPPGNLPSSEKVNRFMASALLSLDAGQGIPEGAHLTYPEIAALSLKPSGLVEYLETHAPYAKHTVPKHLLGKEARPVRILLFFDQFEEILTIVPTDPDVKKDFFTRLTPVLNDYRAMAIFAMREEYVAGLEPYLVYFPERLSARFRLELLGQRAALEAIRKPTRLVNVTFEKKAAELLVEKLSQITVREGGQELKKTSQFVEPVQLQVVCSDLFERRANRDLITLVDVEKHSSVENALGAYYDKKIEEVVVSVVEIEHERGIKELDPAIAARQAMEWTEKALDLERKLRDWIEQELIVSGDLRGQAVAGDESKAGLDKTTIEKLIQAFLVREEPRRGLMWYELSHDSLVRPVVASNAAWRELHASEFEMHERLRNKLTRPTDEMEGAGKLGDAYQITGQYRKAAENFERAVSIARRSGDRRKEGRYLGSLGICYSHQGQNDRAKQYFEQALEIARDQNDREGEGLQLGSLGQFYSRLGQIDRAIEFLEQALTIARENQDRSAECSHLGSLGLLYNSQEHTDRAIEFLKQAVAIAHDNHFRFGEGRNLGSLGLCYYRLGQTESAIECLMQALTIAREIQDGSGEGKHLGSLGLCYGDLGQTLLAEKCLNKALQIARKLEDPIGQGWHLCNLAGIMVDGKRYIEATKNALEGIQIGNRVDNVLIVSQGNLYLGMTYLYSEDIENARAAVEAALKLKYDQPENRLSLQLLFGVIALRQGDLGKAKQAFKQTTAQSQEMIKSGVKNSSVLDARGLALSGLVMCGERQHHQAAIDAFRLARQSNRGEGVVRRAIRLLDAITLVDPQRAEILAGAREAASETSTG